MKKKVKMIAILLGGCFIFGVEGYEKYAIPSLNKVKFEKNLSEHPPLELVKNGRLNFAIVADLQSDMNGVSIPSGKKLRRERQATRIAVDVLQKSFLRTTGKKPVVLSPDSEDLTRYRYKIWVGKSVFTDKAGIQIEKLPKEGFLIRTVKDGVIIAGHDGNRIPGFYHDLDLDMCVDNGTVNGVYDFIERFLGMRFYYPGIGTYVPTVKDLKIESVSYWDAPKFYSRNFGRIADGFIKKGQKNIHFNGTYSMIWPWDDLVNDSNDYLHAYRATRNTRFVCSESPNPFRMQKAFPDKIEMMFARDKDGKLYYSPKVYMDNYFDISNPEFIKLMVDSYEKFYDTNGKWNPIWGWYHPTPEYMCYGSVDTHKVIDNEYTRKHRRKNPTRNSVMSEINSHFYLKLAKEVEKRLPGKKLAVMAYANYLYPPDTISRFPDNMRVMVCLGTPVYIRHSEYEAFFKEIYQGWNSKISGKVVPYLYDPSYVPEGALAYSIRGYFEGELLHKMKNYISDEDIFSCTNFRWEYYYSTYLIARAYWNPEFDVNAAIQEHWKLFFGEKSARSLQTFYDLLINRWVNHYLPNIPVYKRCIPLMDYSALYKKGFPRSIGLKMENLLKQAEKDLPDTPEARRRFLFFVMPWKKIINDIYAYQNLKVPDYQIRFGSVKVDGNLNDPDWKKARVMPLRDAFYGEQKKETVYPEVRMLWNKTGVFLAIKSPAPFVKNGKLWEEDNFEFFIATEGKKNKLFQFVASSSGQFEDYFTSFDPPRSGDILWKCNNMLKAIKSNERGWSAELFIPFTSLDQASPPIPGDFWYGNFISNKAGASATSLSPTLGNNSNISTYSRFYFAGNCE